MNKKLQIIHNKLIECKLGESVRVSILNLNTDAECLVCFLLLKDRFKSIDDLLLSIRNCLQEMSVNIIVINESKLSIMAV